MRSVLSGPAMISKRPASTTPKPSVAGSRKASGPSRVRRVREQIKAVHRQLVGEEEARLALSAFDPVWGALAPGEQARVVRLLVERVDYHGAEGKVAITFYPPGIRTLADKLARQGKEQRA